MTCIIGLIHDGKIWMGGDSAGASGGRLTVRRDPKIFIKDNKMIMGFTSSFRMGELLQFGLHLPVHYVETYEYMITDFVDAVRECLKRGGFSEKDKEVEKGGEFLVGYKGRLFKISSDYQVEEAVLPYNACGSGEDTAMGVIYALKFLGSNNPEKMIRIALSAASEFCSGVREPFTILSLKEV